jgi:hypothetical protein
LDDAKEKIIVDTLASVNRFVSALVNVTPVINYKSPSQLISDSALQLSTDPAPYDLYVPVVGRPFGSDSNTLATAVAHRYIDEGRDYNRPCSGLITINLAKMPTESQNETSGDRQFFVTLVHELMHILAFSENLFNKWIDRTRLKPWENPQVTYENSYGITQRFLVTTNLSNWVHHRFQVVDASLRKLGLEIEDGGGSGTARSHPNSRLYFTDVMQGKTYGPGYISELYENTLWDSGWYDVVNHSMIEELVYMNVALEGVSPPNQNVLVQPAKLSFPASYLCKDPLESRCYYDYSVKGRCSLDTPANLAVKGAADPTRHGFQNIPWYNPVNDTLLGTEPLIDFAPVFLPTDSICRDPGSRRNPEVNKLADKLHEAFTPDSVCAMSTIFNGDFGEVVLGALPACFRARCGTDGVLRMTLDDDREQRCTRPGRKLYSKKHIGHVKCPPARLACATHSKFTTLNIMSAIPDRGPHDGQNFVLLSGLGVMEYFGKCNGQFNLSIGDFALEIVTHDDSRILAKLPTLDVGTTKDLIMVAQPLRARCNGKSMEESPFATSSEIPDFYTFTSRTYAAAWGMASPAVALLVMGAVLSFFV